MCNVLVQATRVYVPTPARNVCVASPIQGARRASSAGASQLLRLARTLRYSLSSGEQDDRSAPGCRPCLRSIAARYSPVSIHSRMSFSRRASSAGASRRLVRDLRYSSSSGDRDVRSALLGSPSRRSRLSSDTPVSIASRMRPSRRVTSAGASHPFRLARAFRYSSSSEGRDAHSTPEGRPCFRSIAESDSPVSMASRSR